MGSVKKNAIYNVLLAVSQIILPLVTFPYISRVLEPKGVGTYTFVDNYTQYFVLIAALGIPIYGMREIAKAKHSFEERSAIFSELLSVHLLFSILILIVYICSFNLIPKFASYTKLFWVGSTLIMSNVFLTEWLFQGMEQFPFITLRTLAIRALVIISILLFVRSATDTLLYYAINCGGVLINAVINVHFARKYVRFSFGLKNLQKHVKPLFYIFGTGLVTSVYTLLDSVMLGFLSNTAQVGFYTTAVKLSKILIMVLSAFTTVLLPPLSLAYREGRTIEASILLRKSFDYVVFLGVPLSFGIFTIARPLILIFSGKDFLPAAHSLQILSPTILIIGLSYVFGQLVINATGRERYFLQAALVGMVLSLSLNLLLVPSLEQLGAATTNLIVELAVMLLLSYFALRHMPFNPTWSNLIKALLSCLPFLLIGIWVENQIHSPWFQLITIMIACSICYFTMQYLIWKNKLFLELFRLLKR